MPFIPFIGQCPIRAHMRVQARSALSAANGAALSGTPIEAMSNAGTISRVRSRRILSLFYISRGSAPAG